MADTDTVHAALREADDALNDGDYTRSVQRAIDAYRELIGRRPELVVRPGPRPPAGAPLIPDRPRHQPRAPWNSTMGVQQTFDANGRAVLTFAKERFTMAEAISYFEYVQDMVSAAEA